MGRKQLTGLGTMQIDCHYCKGIGYITIESAPLIPHEVKVTAEHISTVNPLSEAINNRLKAGIVSKKKKKS